MQWQISTFNNEQSFKKLILKRFFELCIEI